MDDVCNGELGMNSRLGKYISQSSLPSKTIMMCLSDFHLSVHFPSPTRAKSKDKPPRQAFVAWNGVPTGSTLEGTIRT